MVLEREIEGCRGFARALPCRGDREAFQELMNSCRCYAMEAGAAVRPIPSEAMFMAILPAQEKELGNIRASLDELEDYWLHGKSEKRMNGWGDEGLENGQSQ